MRPEVVALLIDCAGDPPHRQDGRPLTVDELTLFHSATDIEFRAASSLMAAELEHLAELCAAGDELDALLALDAMSEADIERARELVERVRPYVDARRLR